MSSLNGFAFYPLVISNTIHYIIISFYFFFQISNKIFLWGVGLKTELIMCSNCFYLVLLKIIL